MTRTPDLEPGLSPASKSIARAIGLTRLAAATALAGAPLLLTAIPALADGGPHVAGDNSGLLTLTADSNPIPNPTVVSGAFTQVAAPGVEVTDATEPPTSEYRNYTVIDAAVLSAVGGDPTAGDYWRLYRPWDGVPTYDPLNGDADVHGIAPALGVQGDQPPGVATGATWRGQITAWCSACHRRYLAPRSAAASPSVAPVYTYRHQTDQTECTQCHVAHGSNAVMDGPSSSTFAYPAEPGDTPLTGSSSRLLKIDNRGTCQACHDPTDTVPFTGVRSNP